MTDSYITHDETVSNKGEKRHKLKEGIRMMKIQCSDIEKIN